MDRRTPQASVYGAIWRRDDVRLVFSAFKVRRSSYFEERWTTGCRDGALYDPLGNLACLVLTNRSDARELAHSVCDQILAGYLPEWVAPEENADLPPSPFVLTREFGGRWAGTLTDGGANMRVKLDIESSDSAAIALDEKPAEKITEMQSEGMAFTGTSTGLIESADAIRNQAETLKIK